MEKQTQSSSAAMQTSPMPSAPPSYEEAIASQPVPGVAPYPVAGTHMPMPTQYVQPAYQMPQPEDIRIRGISLPPQPVMVTHVRYPTNTTISVTEQPERRGTGASPQRSGIVVLGPTSVKLTCPLCHVDVRTATTTEHQPGAHVCCIMLCLVGCCLCSCLPYCLKMFMNVNHYCPSCKGYIGTWST